MVEVGVNNRQELPYPTARLGILNSIVATSYGYDTGPTSDLDEAEFVLD